ncbi:glycosyltransferase [Salinigranum halophilum]|uniref:glycosyltransferase n=1 Tax=Salinigranum halophilum TaxID=2565931 RepID=UPI00115CA0E8
MKICIVSYIYPYPERGYNPGIERVVQESARALARRGHEVHVITTYRNGGEKKVSNDDGVIIHRIPDSRQLLGRVGSAFSLDFLSINYSLRSYRDLLNSSDVVHTFTPIVWKCFSTPLIAHYHHWDDPNELMEYLYLPSSHWLWLKCYAIADTVISVSEYSAQDLSHRGVNEEKIRIVPNGVDPDTYHPGPSQVDLNQWENTLLYVGPLSERKGIKYLLTAMDDILEQYSEVGLIIVGGGDKRHLQNLAKNLGIESHIRFDGFVSEKLLPEYYRAADIFVFPSLLEGFGMVLVEAMASGLPVISTTSSAIPEVVGDAGILVSPKSSAEIAEAVETLILNTRYAQSIGSSGRDRVNNQFTWDNTGKKLQEIYNELRENDS